MKKQITAPLVDPNAICDDFQQLVDITEKREELMTAIVLRCESDEEKGIPIAAKGSKHLFANIIARYINEQTEAQLLQYLKVHGRNADKKKTDRAEWLYVAGPDNVWYELVLRVAEDYEAGSQEARTCLVNVFRRQFPKIYNPMKRLRTMDAGTFISLIDHEMVTEKDALLIMYKNGLVLYAAKLMGIEFLPDMRILCAWQDETIEQLIAHTADNKQMRKELQESVAEIRKRQQKELMKLPDMQFMCRTEHDWPYFAEIIFTMLGYNSPLYIINPLEDGMNEADTMPIWTPEIKDVMYAALKEAEIDFEDLNEAEQQVLMVVCAIVNTMVAHIKAYERITEILFNTGGKDKPSEPEAPAEEQKTSEDKKPEETRTNELAKRLVAAEQRNSMLENNAAADREEIAALKAALQAQEQQLREAEDQKQELIALREYAYRHAENDIVLENFDVGAVKEKLCEKKVVIVGGHENWINKLKKEFPDWTYVPASASGTMRTGALDRSDLVAMFTDHISHPQYNRYLDYTREKNLKLGYLDSVNIDQNIKNLAQMLNIA